MPRIITVPALKSTLGFIILDLVAVGIIGEAVAKRFGFDSSVFIPLSALICIAAGYVATRRGMWGATAGSMMTSVEMLAWIVSGNLTPDIAPPELHVTVAVAAVFAASLAGAALGEIGGWLARRHARVAAGTGTRPALVADDRTPMI